MGESLASLRKPIPNHFSGHLGEKVLSGGKKTPPISLALVDYSQTQPPPLDIAQILRKF